MNLSSIKDFPDKMPITDLVGTVKFCKDVSTIQTQYGEKERIDFVMECDGGEVWVQVWGPLTSDFKGKTVNISATMNKKNALTGAKVNKYNDKNTGEEKFSISADGKHVEILGASNSVEPEQTRTEEPKVTNQPMPGKPTDKQTCNALLQFYKFFIDNGVPPANAGPLASTTLIALNQGKCTPTFF